MFKRRQESVIIIDGNDNTVHVIQGDTVKPYGFEAPEIREILAEMLGVQTGLIKDLMNQNQAEIMAMLKKVLKKDEIVNESNLVKELEESGRENEKLKEQISILLNKEGTSDFAFVLKTAKERLNASDYLGYQKILENFKEEENLKKRQTNPIIGEVAYLQAKSSLATYRPSEALKQINEALGYDAGNEDYWYVKSKALMALFLLPEAIEAYQQLLILTNSDNTRVIAYNDMGFAYQELGKYDEAVQYFERALAIAERNHDIMAPRLGEIFNNLGTIYDDRGELKKALAYYESDLSIQLRQNGETQNPEVGAAYNNIGHVFLKMNNLDSGLSFLLKGLEIWQKILGEHNPRIFNSYINIGLYHFHKQDYSNTLEYYQKALKIGEAFYNPADPKFGKLYYNFGTLYHRQGFYDKAIPMFEKCTEIREKVLGIMHKETRKSIMMLGISCILAGQNEKCRSLLSKLGRPDSAIAERLYVLGKDHMKRVEYASSILLFEESLYYLEKSRLPIPNVLWFDVKYYLATALFLVQNRDRALPILNELLESCSGFADGKSRENVIRTAIKNCEEVI